MLGLAGKPLGNLGLGGRDRGEKGGAVVGEVVALGCEGCD